MGRSSHEKNYNATDITERHGSIYMMARSRGTENAVRN